MKELNEQIVRSNEYFQTGKWVPAAAPTSSLKLPNCTTFCMCAWHWVFNATKSYQLFSDRTAGNFGDAKTWYNKYIFNKGTTPKVAAIAVWDSGKYGHVAFVKSYQKLDNDYYNIVCYESHYPVKAGLPYFREVTYKVKIGESTSWLNLNFIGFCYHPYYSESDPQPIEIYKVGKTYTLQYGLNVRTGPSTKYAKKSRSMLSKDAQTHTTADGVLKKGTQVTCLETTKDASGNTWMRIPSGWVCAIFSGTKYIK